MLKPEAGIPHGFLAIVNKPSNLVKSETVESGGWAAGISLGDEQQLSEQTVKVNWVERGDSFAGSPSLIREREWSALIARRT